MSSKNLKQYRCDKNGSVYFIEEDLVGWYLLVYEDGDLKTASKDYLFDSFEDALFEAEDLYAIKKEDWLKTTNK